LNESELEDLLDPKIYTSAVTAHLGVPSLVPKKAKAAKLKWSARLEEALLEAGKPEGDLDRLIREAKFRTNELAIADVAKCFIPALRGPIDGLMEHVKRKLRIVDEASAP
jgi:hypothetical protein